MPFTTLKTNVVLKYTNFLLADSCVKVTKKRRVNKLSVFDWLRHAKITSYSEHFEKTCLFVQLSANQSFTRNFFATFLHESANRKIVYFGKSQQRV